MVLEKTLENPLECKEIQPINLKGNQSWIFIGRLMLKLKLQSIGHLMWRTDSLEKTLVLGVRLKAGGEGDDRGWDGWMASLTQWMWVWVNSGVGDGQGGLVCCDSWGCKESDMTEQLNWTVLLFYDSTYGQFHRMSDINLKKNVYTAAVRYGHLQMSTMVRQLRVFSSFFINLIFV